MLQWEGQTVLLPFPEGSVEAGAQKAAGVPAVGLTSGLVAIVDVLNAAGESIGEGFTRTPGHAVDVCTLLD